MFTFQPSDNIPHTHPHALDSLQQQAYDLQMKRNIILLASLLVINTDSYLTSQVIPITLTS